jgi:hypothetical protein
LNIDYLKNNYTNGPEIRIRRTLVNQINLLVDSPRSIKASRLAPVKAESIFLRRASGYFDYAARPVASARRAARRAAHRRLLRLAQARRRLLRLRYASGCLGTSRGSSRGSSRRSSSTTSPTPRVRVPRHVAQLVTRLVVDYFTYAARPVASARRAACRVTHRRLLRLA